MRLRRLLRPTRSIWTIHLIISMFLPIWSNSWEEPVKLATAYHTWRKPSRTPSALKWPVSITAKACTLATSRSLLRLWGSWTTRGLITSTELVLSRAWLRFTWTHLTTSCSLLSTSLLLPRLRITSIRQRNLWKSLKQKVLTLPSFNVKYSLPPSKRAIWRWLRNC